TARVLGFVVGDEGRDFAPGPDMGDAFTLPESAMPSLLALAARFTEDNSGADAPVLRATWEAWVRGWANAAAEVGADADGHLEFEDAVRRQLMERGGELVRNANGRAYMQRVVG